MASHVDSAATEPLRWLDARLSDELRYRAALAAIRDHTPHTEYANTYCPACLAEVALDPSRIYGGDPGA